jgi:hypothetical protein
VRTNRIDVAWHIQSCVGSKKYRMRGQRHALSVHDAGFLGYLVELHDTVATAAYEELRRLRLGGPASVVAAFSSRGTKGVPAKVVDECIVRSRTHCMY